MRQLPLRLWPVLRGGGAAKLLIMLSLELKSYKELLCWLACFVHEQRFPSVGAEDRLEAPSPPFPASGLIEQSTAYFLLAESNALSMTSTAFSICLS